MTDETSHAALDHRFTLAGEGAGRALLDSLLRTLARPSSDRAESVYELRVSARGATARVDGGELFTGSIGRAASRLMTAINVAAVGSVPTSDVVHASVVSHALGAIAFPANAGVGKSTISAALVEAGFGYLSDELAPIDIAGNIRPYPKPIVVGPSSFAVLEGLGGADKARGQLDCWFLDPGLVRADSIVTEPLRLAYVVIPRFEPRGETTLRPLSASDVVAALIANSFNIRERRRSGVERLAHIGSQICGLEMIYGDARGAAATLRRHLAVASEG